MEKFEIPLGNDEKIVSEEKEFVFETLIINEIINAFISDLEEFGFEKEEIEDFLKEIDKHDEESIKGILAMPRELRERNFPKYKQDLDDRKTTIKNIVKQLKNIADKNGYTLGYHTSKSDILPNGSSWEVKGMELDDRDDRPMAYYSLDYKNIYRIDRGNNLYVVRAKTGQDTEHKRDTSNNWGRADSLSIIHKINLTDLDEKIDSKLKELESKRLKDAA